MCKFTYTHTYKHIQIDRIVEQFSAKYCADNPDIFPSADNAYILAYSIIMLNVNLHNPKVKSKMTKQQFIKSLRLAWSENDGGKHILTDEALNNIYDSINYNEIQLHQTDSNTKDDSEI